MAALAAPFLFGCSETRDQPVQRLIGFDFFIHANGTSETRLVTLDRSTLRVRGRVLPLGDLATGETDSAATSKTGQLSPDRTMLAVGGTIGEITRHPVASGHARRSGSTDPARDDSRCKRE
jgi:hypothetical protein